MPHRPSTLQITVKESRHTIRLTKTKTNTLIEELKQYLDSNGYLSWSTKNKKYMVLGTNSPKNGLIECPECKIGKLIIIRSRTTRKRFIGCSNYHGGCTASSPLLQKARLRPIKTPCDICSWPLIIFRYSRKQKWTRQCSNINCDSRKAKALT